MELVNFYIPEADVRHACLCQSLANRFYLLWKLVLRSRVTLLVPDQRLYEPVD